MPWTSDAVPNEIERRGDPETTAAAIEIGRKVRLAREEDGWSGDVLSLVAGIGRATLQRIEAGQRIPRADTLMRLACALRMNVEELLPDDYKALFGPKLLEQIGQQFASVPVPLAGAPEDARSSRRSSRKSARSASISRDKRASLKRRIARLTPSLPTAA